MKLFNFHIGIGLLEMSWVALASGQGKDSHVLKPDSFTSTIAKGLWFVKFHSPLCGVCQSLAPIWSEFTAEYSAWGSDNEFHFGEVDCVENTAFCTEAGFEEFPTIVLFKDGKRQEGECSFVDSKKDLVECLNVYEIHYNLNPIEEPTQQDLSQNDIIDSDFGLQEKPQEELKLEPVVTENVNGKIAILTEENFQKSIEKGPWFVKFYAPWCGHCQKLASTWEKLAEMSKGFVNIAQVDCTTDKAVCESMEIRGYPTLKIIKNGKIVEYKGAREMQAFIDELSKKFGDKPVLSPLEAIDKVKQEEVALVFYSSAQSLPEAVEQVISDIGLELPAVRVKGYWPDRAAYNIQNSPSLLIIKDGKVLEFTGSLSDQGQMLEWVTKEQHPMVRSINPSSLRRMFELDEGLVVIKVSSGVTRASDAKSFRDFAEPILRRASSLLFFGIMDADDSDISQWFMLSGKVDPKIVMLDLKTRKFYSANVYGTPIGFNYKEIQDAIEAQKAGKLTGFALKFNNNPSLMTLSLTVVLPIVVIFAAICYFVLTGEPEDEEKKKI